MTTLLSWKNVLVCGEVPLIYGVPKALGNIELLIARGLLDLGRGFFID